VRGGINSQADTYLGGFGSSQRILPPQIIQGLLYTYVAIHGATSESGNKVAVINTRTNTVVKRIPVPRNPGLIAIAEISTPN
jgi:YVTN family beta-propeller protein